MTMTSEEALRVLAEHRGDRIVITTMTAVGIWPGLSDTPLDFAYLPSSMGQGTALALGLALAHPQRGVIVVNGDGSMLMNLGSLVTIASEQGNVFVIVLENGLYEVTGGQPIPGRNRVDFAGMARAAGFDRVYAFDRLESWRAAAGEALAGAGPCFVNLKVVGRLGQSTPKPPRSMSEQIQRLQQALGV